MQPEHDPLLESALEEALGGKSPPDLVARTLARAAAETAPSAAGQPAAGPRPLWRAWGKGLAAAAVVVITAGATVLGLSATGNEPESSEQIAAAGGNASADRSGKNAPQAGEAATGVLDLQLRTLTVTPPSEGEGIPPSDGMPVPDSLPAPVNRLADRLAQDPRQSSPNFKAHGSNPFVDTEDDALSTFALEHDTGSYTVTRAYLQRGELPPEEAVRAEEFINYFDYRYGKPRSAPFTVHMDAAPSRYGADIHNSVLLRVGVQARRTED
ncbi:MAG: von Willebrand factor type A domain-containing protein, partial [Planctomycetes bacterium]|nr:von Willebrand factor type A domain-containing protein [Planctomycetota bacterium]